MTDTLDARIRILVMELMDSAPQAPSLSELEWLENQAEAVGHGLNDETGAASRKGAGRHLRFAAAFAVAAAIVVVASLLVLGGTSPAPHTGSAHVRTGTWKLMDDPLSGTWQQNTTGGPPPGSLSCPTTSTCYTMSGHYTSPLFGAQPISVDLYVSTDVGATWKTLPMPQGFVPTSPIACGGASDCAAGGNDNGQSVLVTTNDGGASFAINPLPSGVGHLDTLSCPSTGFCAGLAADSQYLDVTPSDATFLSTSDGGKTFTDMPIISEIRWSRLRARRAVIAPRSVGTTPWGKRISLQE